MSRMDSGNLQKTFVEKYLTTKALGLSDCRQKKYMKTGPEEVRYGVAVRIGLAQDII